MKLYNKSNNGLTHTDNGNTYVLAKGATAEIPDDIAKIWLKIKGIEKYIGQDDLKKAEKEALAKAKAERESLEKELQKTKEELAKTKEALAKAKAEKDKN